MRVVPHSGLSVTSVWANSGDVVCPMITAPARRSAVTTYASQSGTECSNAWDPSVVRRPATGVVSFTATGTPCSTPSESPRATAEAASRAAWSASSCQTAVKQLSRGWISPIRDSALSITSTGDSAPSRISRATSVADV